MKFKCDGLFCSVKTIKKKKAGETYDDKKAFFFFFGGYIINLYIEPNSTSISSVHILTSL